MSLFHQLGNLDYGLLLPSIARMPVPLARWLADRRGDLHFFLDPSGRHAVRNLTWIFEHLDQRQIRFTARQCFRTQSNDEMESYWFDRPMEDLLSQTSISGLDTLNAALGSGDGVLLYTGHMGSTGLFITLLGKMGIPVNLVFRNLEDVPSKPAAWYRYGKNRIRSLEKSSQRPVLYTGKRNYFQMRQKLREGEALILGIDAIPFARRRSVPVQFFARQASFPEGPARLYLDSRARVLFWSARPGKERRHHIEITDITNRLMPLHEVPAVVQILVDELEARIRKHPGSWLVWSSLGSFFEG